ncbi:NAD(P)-dependent oxidoreductase [Mycobacterium sp. E796]|uniref:NAD-dependent epimerase/dehydratase family protein n=1 Tax=Mycobacterium sp. E796 TaxID=1834151 RepID=UPI000829CDD8|nr:NAD-dependent epimerase/dehydratase family protein [Mycobacterium sp. E796]
MTADRVAITGATGYLGSVLSDHFSNRGDEVVALTRRRPELQVTEWRHFELGRPLDAAIFQDVNTLVHAAWVLSGKDTSQLWRENVIGSRRLIEAAVTAGVGKVVFVSSMSAFFGTRQTYGLMKLAVERTALDMGCVVVRPGLVYGESPGGMAGTLRKISGLPLWPRFKSAKLFLAHEDDVAHAIATVIEHFDELSGEVIGLANPQPVDLPSIFAGLSAEHERRPSLPVPAGPVMAVLRLLELAGVPFPFRSDSLLGLIEAADVLPGQDCLGRHGVEFRSVGSARQPQQARPPGRDKPAVELPV